MTTSTVYELALLAYDDETRARKLAASFAYSQADN
jgi:hypothetical protein